MPKHQRIVSKTEYLARHAGKATLRVGSVVLWLSGMMLGFLTVLVGLCSLALFFTPDLWGVALVLLILAGFMGIGTYVLIKAAIGADNFAEEMEPVLPHTRQAIVHLPVEDTLVRASSEPTQEQEQMLLRAADYSEETPPEQLLRPGSPSV